MDTIKMMHAIRGQVDFQESKGRTEAVQNFKYNFLIIH